MSIIARIADPDRDIFITTNTGERADSFLCGSCSPAGTTTPASRIIVDDGFNKWQRCGGCGELIFTTHLAA